MLKIQVITDTTRPNRVNTQVADWIYGIAKLRSGLDVELVDIADYNLPLLDEPKPPSMGGYTQEHTKVWAAKVAEADGYVFVLPEYNHGIPGSLKNAIDFIYAEWNNKAAGFVSYGSGGGVRSAEHMRAVTGELQIADVRAQVMLNLQDDFENYSVFKPRSRHEDNANTLLDQLTAWAEVMKTVREGTAAS